MTDLVLAGCRPEPLGSYLKALGVLRLVSEQLDPAVTGRWSNDQFVLGTEKSIDEIADFFLDDYCPTPLVAPWNGRSGFRLDANRPSEQRLQFFEAIEDERLHAFRTTIQAGRKVYDLAEKNGWDTKKDKEKWVEACRASFPDEALEWLDAVAVLTADGPAYPPLLGGSGGVLGSLDLSSNLLWYLVITLGIEHPKSKPNRERSREWLLFALAGRGRPGLLDGAIGQFDPGQAGGVNSSPLGDSGGIVNPWDYVLLLEGSVVFASGVARRLGPNRGGRAAIPFTVRSTDAGYGGGAEDEPSSGEVWAPLWANPVTAVELNRLFSEGRAQWGRKQAASGLDFARAAASLGVDRGIDAFVRHAFVERLGQTKLAVPVGRIEVKERPQVRVLAQLDSWIDRVRRAGKNAPQGVRSALARVDQAQFDVATRGGPRGLQQVLSAVADLERAVARSSTLRSDTVTRPCGGAERLDAGDWLPVLYDGTAEFRIAAALAFQWDFDRRMAPSSYLRAVGFSDQGRLEWSSVPTIVPGLSERPVVDVLSALLARRAIDSASAPVEPRSVGQGTVPASAGTSPAFTNWRPAPIEDVAAFIEGELDGARLAEALSGLLLLRRAPDSEIPFDIVPADDRPIPPAWALLAPFYQHQPVSVGGDQTWLVPDPSWPRRLVAGRVADVITEALLRLRIARLDPAPADGRAIAAGVSGDRLAAGLLIPLTRHGTGVLLRQVVPPPLEAISSSPNTEE